MFFKYYAEKEADRLVPDLFLFFKKAIYQVKTIDFRIFLSNLFHSITIEGKKGFLRKSCLNLKEGTFSTFLVK